MTSLYDRIWSFVSDRVDEGVLPHEDEIYTKFQRSFEIGGADTDLIEEAIKSVVNCTDMDGVEIEWEGKLNGISNRRTLPQSEVPSKTA